MFQHNATQLGVITGEQPGNDTEMENVCGEVETPDHITKGCLRDQIDDQESLDQNQNLL